MADGDSSGGGRYWPFLAGVVAGAAGAVLAQSFYGRRGFDAGLIRVPREHPDVPATVIVPGILGSQLLRPDGSEAWLNLGNAFGSHDVSLPIRLPLAESRDDLVPGGLIGVDAVLPRLFGFTEYGDLLELLDAAGFQRDPARAVGARYHVFTYDWRRDLVESARRLGETLDAMADASGDPAARFNVIGHSMGGLVARYYLRYGGAEPGPDAPVTWAGARRMRKLVMVATPNAGSIPSLDAILNGNRVGLSTTTLAASVIAGLPAIYQLLPAAGAGALLDHRAEPLAADLHDPLTWERFGWGPYAPAARRAEQELGESDLDARRAFLAAALARARAVHRALDRAPATRCPARVVALGGDCLPTLARAIVPESPGAPPRFEPWTRAESLALFEAGDGRVPRASVLASHLPGAERSELGCGLPEVQSAFFGAADHHGIYAEATFQSVLLRLLLRPARRPEAPARAVPLAAATP